MASLRGMSVIQLLDIHNSSSATAPSPKIKLGIFVICCFSMLSVYLYSVLFKSSISFCIRLTSVKSEVMLLLMINCVDNENEGEFNFNTWQQINRTKSQYSSKLQMLGPWRPLDFMYFIFCNRTHKSRRHTGSVNHSAEQFQGFCNHSLGIKSLSVSIFLSVSWLPS